MNKKIFLVWMVALTFMGGSALAQDQGDGDRVPVYAEPVYITVNHAEPLALYVRDVDGDKADVAVMVRTIEGWMQLTPCDNVDVPCKALNVKAEGVEAGDIFYLNGD